LEQPLNSRDWHPTGGHPIGDNASITWLIINLSEGEKHDKNYLCTV